jgi:chromosomal replication initiator protein
MSVSGSLDQQWARVRGRLRDEVGETAFGRWLKPLCVTELRGSEVRIAVPTRFMRDWVLTHYADRIRALWVGENPHVQSVEIVVAPQRVEIGSSANDDGGLPPAPAPAPVSTRDSPSRTSSSASRTSWPMRRRGASPRRVRSPSTRCSSTEASASARPT